MKRSYENISSSKLSQEPPLKKPKLRAVRQDEILKLVLGLENMSFHFSKPKGYQNTSGVKTPPGTPDDSPRI